MSKIKYTLTRNRLTGVRSVWVQDTGELVRETEQPARYAELRRKALANARSRGRDEAYRSAGMIKTPYGWE